MQPRRRILVVDDNVDSAETLAKLLRLHGHAVNVAFDGQSALDETLAKRPEVVILDLGLPGISGFEVASSIRADVGGGDPLLIAVSGYGREEDQQRAREAGFNQHFTKPVNFADLLRFVSEASNRPSTLQVF